MESQDLVRRTNPYLIQRMKIENDRADVRFSSRFKFDYMNSAEFKIGYATKCLRELHANSRKFQVPIDNRLVTGLYRPELYNIDGIQEVLEELYEGKRRTKEYTEFTRDSQKEIRDERKRGARYVTEHADAWLDIESGLFWAFRKINLDSVRENIRLAVEYMDASDDERAKIIALEQARENEMNPLRAQMIKEGRLRPMSHDAVKQVLMWSKKRI